MEPILARLRNGESIGSRDPDIDAYMDAIKRCYDLVFEYNSTPGSREGKRPLLSKIVGYEVPEDTVIIPPFHCDLGINIRLGKNVLVNYKCTFLDSSFITVGEDTMIGPGCQLVTACHPLRPEDRKDQRVWGEPITLGKGVWLGAGVTVLPGVTIGDGSVIGAGSVVTKDIPPRSVAVGNPARVIKSVDD